MEFRQTRCRTISLFVLAVSYQPRMRLDITMGVRMGAPRFATWKTKRGLRFEVLHDRDRGVRLTPAAILVV